MRVLTAKNVVGNGVIAFFAAAIIILFLSAALETLLIEVLVAALALVSTCVLSCLHFIEYPNHLDFVQTHLPTAMLVTLLIGILVVTSVWLIEQLGRN